MRFSTIACTALLLLVPAATAGSSHKGEESNENGVADVNSPRELMNNDPHGDDARELFWWPFGSDS
eukprot:CAMPEP_0194027354 /NCGR_PEP_ID=MMETSP0009_2-20130614/1516_1 /TAXON_ID=210454 /ORGANISM="Grammatophora oceanica, Strain CCMP 410" /LENGTH=65 /DNA_ID=CAMNT_0038666397 /DNA_START=23 /DNA_END=217 /DNA_ORIENTATION=+